MKIVPDYIYSLKKTLMLATLILLTGCSEKHIEPPKETAKLQIIKQDSNITISDARLYDRLNLSQNPLDYLTDTNQSKQYEFLDPELLKRKLFMVWDNDFKASVSESLWVLDIIKKDGYKENLQRYSTQEKAKLVSTMYSATAINHFGIISRNTDIRAFPTKKPYFYDPQKAGEGYPFDNFQSSKIYTNTPVMVAAVSPDGAFYYIASSLTDGWVDSRDVLLLTKAQTEFLRSADILVSVDDKVSLFDTNGKFIDKMAVGSFVFDQNGSVYSVNNDKISQTNIDRKVFIKYPLEFSQKALASLAKEIMDEPYGWGGHLDNRDCSMFLRDLFLPFGLYLPRNSNGQAKKGETYIDLSSMSEAKKIEFIKKRAVPFTTFLYLKGHILLYLGVVNDEIVALHDVWGFAYEENKTEKRYIIGKPIISTLYVGSTYENFMKKKSVAARLQGIRVLE